MIRIVVSGVNIIITLAGPSDIDEWVLQLTNIFIGLFITFFFALITTSFFILFNLKEVLRFFQMLIDQVERFIVGLETNLKEFLVP